MTQHLVTIIALKEKDGHMYAVPDVSSCGAFHIPLQAPLDTKVGDRGIAVFDISGYQYWREGSYVWNGYIERHPEAVGVKG